MKTIEHFILGFDGQQKTIISFLHELLITKYDLMGKISYNIPMYSRKSAVCYLNPIKNDGIELTFVRGHLLSNEHELLKTKNRKYAAGIEIYQIDQFHEIAINQIIQEALVIDDFSRRYPQ